MVKQFKLWLALVGLAFFVSCSQQSELTNQGEIHGRTMGTTYSVKYFYAPTVIQQDELKASIDAALQRVNEQMSTYLPESELSQFNQSDSLQPFTVSKDTAYVIDSAIKLGTLTKGALDVTVGPLVNLWGFGPDKKPDTIPSDDLIEQTRSRTGLDKLSVKGTQIIKSTADLYVDLSAIAKGFGVDKVAELLEQKGIVNYLVEIGGEMRQKGHKADKQAWRIAVEKPVSGQHAVQQVLELGDMAIATSGDYRNYFEENGVRYSHTIDPKTAKPISHSLVSVTVLDASCMRADGLATALNVMGPEAAFAFANAHKLPVYLVIKADDGFVVKYTDSFKPYMR
ncbi:FAD:protein FMN transferase [Gayadomonas joobiniege]|uniref:FAD:protein FMN transferase n=1 Tax=Gayadomonas joobiniege TaxID=1234606 RepID=UPI00037D63F0|nr:FAD:protein FMN transferase [Gayadomonas joobiniege]